MGMESWDYFFLPQHLKMWLLVFLLAECLREGFHNLSLWPSLGNTPPPWSSLSFSLLWLPAVSPDKSEGGCYLCLSFLVSFKFLRFVTRLLLILEKFCDYPSNISFSPLSSSSPSGMPSMSVLDLLILFHLLEALYCRGVFLKIHSYFFLSFLPVFQFWKFPLTYLSSHWLFKWLCQIYFCALWRISLFLLLSFWFLASKCYFILSSSFPLCWNYLSNSAFPIFSIRTCITPLKRM